MAGLRRSISLVDVIGLGLNAVVGQGIFLLPGLAAAMVGPAAVLALLIAAALAFLIALCYAEVGGRFQSTGGAYLYAREAFGSFVGFEVGWILFCIGVISWAAVANGFTVVLGRFIPAVAEGWLQPVVSLGLMTVLMLVNIAGAKPGAWASTLFSAAKLLPMFAFVVIGVGFFDGDLVKPFAPHGYARLGEATVLLLYAFAGFEVLVIPAGEMKHPQRAIPIALIVVLALVCVIYTAIFLVTAGTLPGLAGHQNPVAAASTRFMGAVGGSVIAAGIVVSVLGVNAGAALINPRKAFAMAERGDFPAVVGRVHEGSGAPRVAILVTFLVAAGLSLTGSFKDLAVLGVVARFVQYIATCVAVLVLRRRRGPADGFRVPFGPVIPLLAVGLCLWLIASADPSKLLGGLIALALGVPCYLLRRWWGDGAAAHDDR